MGQNVEASLKREDLENFLFQEASYLDQGELDQWLDLFTQDAHYWIPVARTSTDPKRELSIIYDDRKRLEERVWRIQSGLAYAQQPRSRTQHVIGNVQVGPCEENLVKLFSNFVLVELRHGAQNLYSGRFEHTLRWVDGSWKIEQKKVLLLNSEEPIGNLTFLI